MSGFASSEYLKMSKPLVPITAPPTLFVDDDYDNGDYKEVATHRPTHIPNTVYRYYTWEREGVTFLVEAVEKE